MTVKKKGPWFYWKEAGIEAGKTAGNMYRSGFREMHFMTKWILYIAGSIPMI